MHDRVADVAIIDLKGRLTAQPMEQNQKWRTRKFDTSPDGAAPYRSHTSFTTRYGRDGVLWKYTKVINQKT